MSAYKYTTNHKILLCNSPRKCKICTKISAATKLFWRKIWRNEKFCLILINENNQK